MSGMQMTGMDEGRGRGSAVGRFSAHDEAGATKTCPRCGAVLFSDMNRCYGCLYDFPEQVSEANPTALDEPWENVDEPWENVDEPWGSLDGLWAEGEAAGGGAPPSAEMRDAALEESVGMPDVAPDVEEGAEGEPRAGVSESSGAQVRGVPCVRIKTPVSTVVVEVDGSNVTIRQEPLGGGERRPKACS